MRNCVGFLLGGCITGRFATGQPSGHRRPEASFTLPRQERMFPGEGGIDLVGLTKEMPRDITISIEVPTAELAKTLDAESRVRRALLAAKAVVAAAAAS